MRDGQWLTSDVQMKLATFAEYVEIAQNADIALWTPSNYWGRVIARFTGGPFSHVTGVVNWTEAGGLFSVGYEEGGGGFGKPLDVESKRNPERIHIYRVKKAEWKQVASETGRNVDEIRSCVSRQLCRVGWEYNWGSIWLITRPFVPFLGATNGNMKERVLRASGETRKGICSQHVHRSFGGCGVRFSDRSYALTSPNDIADSVMTKYICTLTGEA